MNGGGVAANTPTRFSPGGIRQRFLHFGAVRSHPHALCTLEAFDIGVTPFSWLIRKGVYYFP